MRPRVAAVGALMLAVMSLSVQAQVTQERLLRAADEPHNWITYSGITAGVGDPVVWLIRRTQQAFLGHLRLDAERHHSKHQRTDGRNSRSHPVYSKTQSPNVQRPSSSILVLRR